MRHVNVVLKDKLLDEINKEAREQKTNRSALIQTVLEKYIEGKRRGHEEEEKRKMMQEASRKLDALAKKLGKWDAQKIIWKFRESNMKGDS